MLSDSPLGQKTAYVETYAPDLLYPVPRSLVRENLGISSNNPLPFTGVDIWNAFEISWLSPKGKPEIALGEFRFPCQSPYIVESKSLKLYLNSFNQSNFSSMDAVQKTMQSDLTKVVQMPVEVNLTKIFPYRNEPFSDFEGLCLDHLDIETDVYDVEPRFLKTTTGYVEEKLYSNLLKSNCLATGQPDWGSVFIHYAGQQIDHEGLLKYFFSFRRHKGFAEHFVEQAFHDLMIACKPEKLTVYARYTRRGGLDINPFRSNCASAPLNLRQIRQ